MKYQNEALLQISLDSNWHILKILNILLLLRWLQSGASGMAVQEIGVPTGFEADVESIGKVDGLKKIEQGSRKVILYFDEVRTFFFVKLLFAKKSENF